MRVVLLSKLVSSGTPPSLFIRLQRSRGESRAAGALLCVCPGLVPNTIQKQSRRSQPHVGVAPPRLIGVRASSMPGEPKWLQPTSYLEYGTRLLRGRPQQPPPRHQGVPTRADGLDATNQHEGWRRQVRGLEEGLGGRGEEGGPRQISSRDINNEPGVSHAEGCPAGG